MKYKLLIACALVISLMGVVLLGLGMQKSITLIIDRHPRTINTYAFTVEGLLQSANIPLNSQDKIIPKLSHFLKYGDKIIIERANQVTIQADGKISRLLTPERIPANLLAQANIPIFPGDKILANNQVIKPETPLPATLNINIQIQRANQLTLYNGSETLFLSSSAATIGQALWEAGIYLHANDLLEPPAETSLNNASEVTLKLAQEVVITINGEEKTIRTTSETVSDALAEAGFSLQGLDYSLPAPGDRIPADRQIRIIKVRESLSLETEPIAFETQYQALNDLELDQQQVVSAGSYGLLAQQTRIRYEDGHEVSRELESKYIIQEPHPRIIGYGTKIVPKTINTPGGVIKYWRALTMWATSYSPSTAGGTITATGVPLRKGLVAIDTTYIPFGTRMYVPGYGEALAADRGGGIHGRMIDLGYSDADYVSWHQWVTVYFLWPPPANIVWIIP